MSTYRHDPHAGDYAEIERERAAQEHAEKTVTPRLRALVAQLAEMENPTYEVLAELGELRLDLGWREISESAAFAVRWRFGLVAPVVRS